MYNIIYDDNANPEVIFPGLTFKLKSFDFDKDILFQNMEKIKNEDPYESIMMLNYEFKYDNIIDKIKELFPSGIVDISDTMFIQLYLYMVRNNFDKKFIFKRKMFSSLDKAQYTGSVQSEFDNRTNMLYVIYNVNYTVNELLGDVKCFYDHINIIKTGLTSDGILCYTGLTLQGIKTMTVMEWAQYLKKSCKEFFVRLQTVVEIEYEESNEIDVFSAYDTKIYEEHMKIYRMKKDLDMLNNYYNIGYFDIWEMSNGLTTFAINVEKNMIVDIK